MLSVWQKRSLSRFQRTYNDKQKNKNDSRKDNLYLEHFDDFKRRELFFSYQGEPGLRGEKGEVGDKGPTVSVTII